MEIWQIVLIRKSWGGMGSSERGTGGSLSGDERKHKERSQEDQIS